MSYPVYQYTPIDEVEFEFWPNGLRLAKDKKDKACRLAYHSAKARGLNPRKIFIKNPEIHSFTVTRNGRVADEPHITIAVKTDKMVANKTHQTAHLYTLGQQYTLPRPSWGPLRNDARSDDDDPGGWPDRALRPYRYEHPSGATDGARDAAVQTESSLGSQHTSNTLSSPRPGSSYKQTLVPEFLQMTPLEGPSQQPSARQQMQSAETERLVKATDRLPELLTQTVQDSEDRGLGPSDEVAASLETLHLQQSERTTNLEGRDSSGKVKGKEPKTYSDVLRGAEKR